LAVFFKSSGEAFSSASRSARKLWWLQTVAELGLGARHRPSNHVNVTIWKRCGAARVVFHIGSVQIESVVRHDFVRLCGSAAPVDYGISEREMGELTL